VALTAASGGDDRERSLAAGMNGFIVKPLKGKELLAVVGAALTEASAEKVTAEPKPTLASLADEMGVDQETARAITLRFLDEAIRRCEALRGAAAGGEARTVEHLGHYIKGGAAQLAIDTVRDLAAALEAIGKSGDLASATRLLMALESEIATARERVGGQPADA
jgi:HPt (histidine-containing phosphotransfer) domain-containing protein